jgi:GNAT superfamily N-acetyltransferase
VIVRPAAPADAPALPAIEASAGALFETIPELAWVSGHAPTSAEAHLAFIAEGISYVAEDEGALVGFLVGSFHGGDLYIDELSVAAGYQRRGFGQALIAAADAHARAAGYTRLTLTTFRAVPWNGPYYRRLGFREFSPAPASYLGAILAREAARGLPDRCAMRRAVRPIVE